MSKTHFQLCLLLIVSVGGATRAQVPVFEEPRHKVALLNDYIRLLDVRIPPNDTTLYHIHSTPSAVVFLTKNITGSQMKGGQPSTGQSVPGNTFFASYGDKPITHRVWNQDADLYHVMDIEILKQPDALPCAEIKSRSMKLDWDEKPARMYSIHVDASDSLDIIPGNCGHLLVLIKGSAKVANYSGKSQAKTNISRMLNPADFFWFDPGMHININTGNDPADCVLLEIK